MEKKVINDIHKCKLLPIDKLHLLADKFNIDYSKLTDTHKICNQIYKKANEINPCGIILHNDTDMSLKKHQIAISNKLIEQRGVIAVHSVGTGKTLSAIACSQCLINKKIVENVIVITPTSLQKNFINQAKQYGLTDEQLERYYEFYTIQGIATAIENSKAINPTGSLIIIDEAHNLRTLGGSRFDVINKYAKKAEKVLLLTATPLINYDSDIINLIALATGDKPISADYLENMINSENHTEFKNYIKDYFNFYIRSKETSTDPNFPSKKIMEVFLPMEKTYLQTYERIEKGHENKIEDFRNKNIHVFYNGLRRASNIIEKKSPKVEWIQNKIKEHINKTTNTKSLDAKFVIYSNFINMGIVPVMRWLDSQKISFEHVTGDLSIEQRNKSVTKYNNDEIQILFISKAGSEGLDLKNTRYIIIMESTWNENSIEQIIGRGVRYKSHFTLPKSKQNVTVYRLYCIKPNEYKGIKKIVSNNLLELNNNNMLSVDLYLRNYSLLKQLELDKFLKLIIKYS